MCFEMVESFENLHNILRDWAEYKVQKLLVEALNRCEKQYEERKIRFSSRNTSEKKGSISLSRQSNETKPNTKLVLKLAYLR